MTYLHMTEEDSIDRPYTNSNLFSNHYLDESLPKREAWDDVDDKKLESVRDEMLDLWENEKEIASKRNESQLETNFIRPMFRELNIPFEVEESVNRSQRRPDYAFFETESGKQDAFQRREQGGDFYKNAVAVADAKRWDRPLDTRGSEEEKHEFKNPSYQIHIYLQKTPTRWAVLTNGRKWRIYYGPTSRKLDSYYEIDLPKILEQSSLEEFKYFYLFFRREAFVEDSTGDCFLDDVYEKSNLFAEKLGEDLEENIYKAIRILSEGFLQYRQNEINKDNVELDRIRSSSLIYLYRIIFVLYAEADGRNLLDTNNPVYDASYSLNSLKQEVAEELDSGNPQYQDWQTNIWDRLEELFQLIDQGSKQQGIPEDDLHIPAYNGGLFRMESDDSGSDEVEFLAENKVGDEHLAQVIELLTRRVNPNGEPDTGNKVFVDYSSLDVRHLGSIYEGLLEYQLNIADEDLTVNENSEYEPVGSEEEIIVEKGDVYLTTDSGERKATGSYYTPEYIVEYMVQNTLKPLVQDIRKDLVAQDAHGEGGFAKEFADRIFELKILDPAMGSGHFLTSVVDYLAREIIDAQEKQAEQEGIESINQDHDIYWARRQVAQQCIYGVDINPLAVELSKVSLWLRTLAAEQPLAFLDHHLKVGNSLTGSDIETVLDNGDPDSNTEEGQLTLQESFDRTRQRALEHVTDQFEDLLSIDNETLDDIKEMETVYEEVRDDPLYQRLIAMANVHTAEEFGLDVPEGAYKDMAKALRDDSWDKVESQDWYGSAQAIADKQRFFHWELEFPIAFYGEDGQRREEEGFDAVIGNPPYVKRQNISDQNQQTYYESKYASSCYNFDLYLLFTEQGHQLLNADGFMTYILPSKFTTTDTGRGLRQYIDENANISEFVDFGTKQVFEGVTTYTCLLFLNNRSGDNNIIYREVSGSDITNIANYDVYKTSIRSNRSGIGWDIGSAEISLSDTGVRLEELGEVITGIETGSHEVLVFEPEDEMYHKFSKYCGEIVRNALKGDSVDPYIIDENSYRVIVPYHDNGELMSTEYINQNFPEVYEYLQENKAELESREDGKMEGDSWYGYVYPKNLHRYESTRIVWPDIAKTAEFAIDNTGSWHMRTVCSLILDHDTRVSERALTSILNSNLFTWFILQVSNKVRGGYLRFKPQYVTQFPVYNFTFSVSDEKRSNRVSTLINNYEDCLSGEDISIEYNSDGVAHDLLAELSERMSSFKQEYHMINHNLLDYIGIPSSKLPENISGKTLEDLFMPVSGVADTPLIATEKKYDGLRIEKVSFTDDSEKIILSVDVSYKPDEDDPRETDSYQRLVESEFETYEAMAFVGLSELEESLLREFIPVAVDKASGFANFRDNATKTISPLDRLKELTLPDLDEVQSGLEQYMEIQERSNELETKIEKTNQLIDEIVYDLYDLSDEEIKIVEEEVDNE